MWVRSQASQGRVQGKWGLGGIASFKDTVPAAPVHGSTCVCLSHDWVIPFGLHLNRNSTLGLELCVTTGSMLEQHC